MNNKIMQLMGQNEWDTPNVRRACKGAFEPQDRHQKDARQKRARADKPFYDLLKEYRSMEFTVDSKFEDLISRVGTLEDMTSYWEEKCGKLEKQIKGQKTRIKNLKNK